VVDSDQRRCFMQSQHELFRRPTSRPVTPRTRKRQKFLRQPLASARIHADLSGWKSQRGTGVVDTDVSNKHSHDVTGYRTHTLDVLK
jgi:hypothetical protein